MVGYMASEDMLFGQAALDHELLTQAQVSECLALKRVDPGSTLGEICVLRGYLTRDQVHQLCGRIGIGTNTAGPAGLVQSPPTGAEPPFTLDLDPPGSIGDHGAPTINISASPAPRPAPQPKPQTAPRSGPVPKNHSTANRRANVSSGVKAHPQLSMVLNEARRRRCSDVHIASDRAAAYRFANELSTQGAPIANADVRSMLLSIMATHQRNQLEQVGYSDFAIDVAGAGRFRVNVGRHSRGLKGCFRLIRDEMPSLASLGLPAQLEKITDYHQGLAVVSGPNGQGKTATLAALVNMINVAKPCHIITVEDPVEYIYPISKAVISQREVGVHTRSFSRALKAALREDPDVIIIGELRDLETVEIALEAAETGHLVIGTMSTRSGAKTINRIIDMFPPERQSPVRNTLAGALKLIISQRLILGTQGEMVAAAEMLTGGIQLWNLIKDNKLIQLPSLMQRGLSMGMIRLDESLKYLVNNGRITVEAALACSEDPRQLQQELNRGMQPAPQDAPLMNAPMPPPTEESSDPTANNIKQISSKIGGFFRRK